MFFQVQDLTLSEKVLEATAKVRPRSISHRARWHRDTYPSCDDDDEPTVQLEKEHCEIYQKRWGSMIGAVPAAADWEEAAKEELTELKSAEQAHDAQKFQPKENPVLQDVPPFATQRRKGSGMDTQSVGDVSEETSSTCSGSDTSERQQQQQDQDQDEIQRPRVTLPPGIQTLVMRNLPLSITRKGFVEALNRAGFQGRYDLVYLPLRIKGAEQARGTGYAFVNMVDNESAIELAYLWSEHTPFESTGGRTRAIKIAAAAKQGRDECLKEWCTSKQMRVRNAESKPLRFECGQCVQVG